MPPRNTMGAWLVMAAIGIAFVAMYFMNPNETVRNISETTFRSLVLSNRVEKVERVTDKEDGSTYLLGQERAPVAGAAVSGAKPDATKPGAKPETSRAFRVQLSPGENADLMKFIINEHGIECANRENSPLFGPFMRQLLIFGLIVGLFYFFFFRQIKNANGGPFGVGKSRAKLLTEEKGKKKITFKDVAGIDEAKEEVQEIIEFLKAPDKFKRLGGRIPKGVLLVGPPGTGKTLLAKAIAGEAGVPFFSISGSDFVEMFVGVGASRVRDMFDQGKKHAPCIIFIDEIDAVGQKRSLMGGNIGGGHSEQEQTLNALLVEMDGFDSNEGVIIVAATNRPDVLDPALLRPGRFDRQIMIDLPTLAGRENILKLHAKTIKFAPGVDLKRIARGTPGFSGADLANLLNEAALLAARKNLDGVTQDILEEARDKVLWGRERRSAGYSKKEREITAWHESGHALLQLLLPHTDPLHKVTIIPRGRALGATMSLPNHDVLNRTRSQFLDELVVFCGGRLAEEIHTGEISTGAAMDITEATKLARNMVCRFGMSDTFGFQSFQEPPAFSAEETPPPFSPATAEAIDLEVKRLVDEAYAKAKKMLDENLPKLTLLATTLLDKESMDGRDVEKLLGITRPDDADGADEPAAPADAPATATGSEKASPPSASAADNATPSETVTDGTPPAPQPEPTPEATK